MLSTFSDQVSPVLVPSRVYASDILFCHILGFPDHGAEDLVQSKTLSAHYYYKALWEFI